MGKLYITASPWVPINRYSESEFKRKIESAFPDLGVNKVSDSYYSVALDENANMVIGNGEGLSLFIEIEDSRLDDLSKYMDSLRSALGTFGAKLDAPKTLGVSVSTDTPASARTITKLTATVDPSDWHRVFATLEPSTEPDRRPCRKDMFPPLGWELIADRQSFRDDGVTKSVYLQATS